VNVVLLLRACIALVALLRARKGTRSKGLQLAVFVWFGLVPVAVTLLFAVVAGQIYFLPLVLAIMAIALPWTTARLVLIPRGWVKPAYYLTWLAEITFELDRRGGAALAAAWALGMKRSADDETAAWVAEKIAQCKPLGGAGVMASGLLLAARGDVAGARALAASVHEVHESVSPPAARRLAAGWIATEAAGRGDWRSVAERGATFGEGRQAWLLSAVAQSLLLEPMSPGRLGLWLRWAIAPARRATLPMVRRALDALDGVFIHPDDDAPERLSGSPEPESNDGWAGALARHASLLRRPADAVREADLIALGKAWDAVLADRATEHAVAERALLLGASDPRAALGKIRGAVEDDLCAVLEASGLPLDRLGDGGEVLGRVRRRVRDGFLISVEAASDAIRRRVDDKRELPAADEWREWTALREAYERGVRLGGQDFRRLAFYKVNPDVTSLAVWLFNDRSQKPLGNVMFQWLLAEAVAIDDARAIALQTKNVGCGV
jgi:hypothetical protein